MLLINEPYQILPKDGQAWLFPEFISAEKADAYFKNFMSDVSWQQEPILIFGKWVMQPRLTALYGTSDKPFGYSGIIMKPHPMTKVMLEIKNQLTKVCDVDFNTILFNQYRNGQDSMGWHRDNETELGVNPVVASISFGDTRKFRFRHYNEKKRTVDVDLTHGSLLLMTGSTQHHWEHALPKTARSEAPRINLTFRKVY
ncbi:MAG: alpha-ketoglutarate-dependent dioxygenase AlkB [Bdellovibrio sp.]|nr:alpha-ketoglutarate-dependent dioxygenase AlkB [Bdellovibrio sp.]